jgi:CelD/BcsL family acetyltransferase involved in cellulose biosynthesis
VLGFPRDSAAWRRWCDQRGLLLIEDSSHAWSATRGGHPVGSLGDLSLFSPYETLRLPRLGLAVLKRSSDWCPRAPDSAEPCLEARDEAPPRSRLWARIVLSHVAGQDSARALRENYRLLLEQLADLVPKPFDELPDGASPIAFPVEVPDKAALLRRLADHGVRGNDFWSAPDPSLPPEPAATAARRRQRTVVLPMHPRLTFDGLTRIADAVRSPRQPPEHLVTERVDDLRALGDEWTALAAQTRNVFASWEWHCTWWDHFENDRPLEITALRDGRGALRAVVPLYLVAERPLRVARFIGNRAGDQLGPICAPGDEQTVSRALRGLLRSGEWDVVLGEQLPADSAWGKRLSGHTVRREGSPVLRLTGTWEETTSSWSSSLRWRIRRDERRLRSEHDMNVRTVSEPEELGSSLDTLFRLHRDRWPQGTLFERREDFHRDFARRALENGWLRLRILEADGEPIAAFLGYRFSGVESKYQSGWDTTYAYYSPGQLLDADTMRSAHADGMQEFRFLRGGEAYKSRFATADPGLETVIFSRDGLSSLARAGAALARTPVPRYARRVLDSSA